MIIRLFFTGVLISLSHSNIDYDYLAYDPFIGEPDLYGWDEAEVYRPPISDIEQYQFISDAAYQTPKHDTETNSRSLYRKNHNSPFTTSEKIKTIKLISKSLNISDADWNDPFIKNKMLKKLKVMRTRDTRQSLTKMLSKDQSGRAWSLEDMGSVITSFTGPSALECLDYRQSGMSCYPNIGCFGHGYSDLDKLCRFPEDDIKVTFKLYSRKDKTNGVDIDAKWNYFPFKLASNVVIYFHGFMGSGKDGNAIKIKDAILDETDYDHVILPDYEWAVRGFSYARALANCDYIGRRVGHLLEVLNKNRGLKISKNVYLIGYSLGVIVSHFTAKHIKDRVKKRPGRVTALDPAAPLLEYCKDCPITKEDAKFVDVIHTSGGYDKNLIAASYLWGYLGIKEPVGHVDFYPNGGGFQMECSRRWIWKKIADPICSHAKSVEFFINSMKGCEYKSTPCSRISVYTEGAKSCTPIDGHGNRMGYHADRNNGTGIQYVQMEVILFC